MAVELGTLTPSDVVSAAPQAEGFLVVSPAAPPPMMPATDRDYDGSAMDLIHLYVRDLKGADNTPLLTANQEIELATQVQLGLKADKRLSQQADISAEERKKLEGEVSIGQAARDHMIRASTRLVISIAKWFIGGGLPFPDLIQDGNVGLMKAVNKFDPEFGCRFSTYAEFWIKQAISRAIADGGSTIRIPVHIGEKLKKLCRLQDELQEKLGRPPTTNELKNALIIKTEISKKRAATIIRARDAYRAASLDKPVGDDGDDSTTLLDFISDPEALDPREIAVENDLREKLEELLRTLPAREERILRLRFGLTKDGHRYTLDEVGQKFGVTRERIRQIEAEALRRLRHPSRSRQLKGFL